MTEYLIFEAPREDHYTFAAGLIYNVFVMYLFYLYCY